MSTYQQIYSTIEPNSRYKVTVADLKAAKDMFIVQVMAGGLRGWHDLKTCIVRKYSSTLQMITFKVGKKDDAIENPMNVYLQAIHRDNQKTLPFIDNEQLYSALIRTVVVFIGQTYKEFDREVKPDKYQNKYIPVYEAFRHGYFARKSFGQILRRLGLSREDIEMFTGHEKNSSGELAVSYLDDNAIEN